MHQWCATQPRGACSLKTSTARWSPSASATSPTTVRSWARWPARGSPGTFSASTTQRAAAPTASATATTAASGMKASASAPPRSRLPSGGSKAGSLAATPPPTCSPVASGTAGFTEPLATVRAWEPQGPRRGGRVLPAIRPRLPPPPPPSLSLFSARPGRPGTAACPLRPESRGHWCQEGWDFFYGGKYPAGCKCMDKAINPAADLDCTL
jgi:hypothetical protein